MKHSHRYISSILLTAAIAAPLAFGALAPPQDRKEEKREAKREEKAEKARERYYDKRRKHYHDWDEREDRNYRVYLTERHRPFIEFRIQRDNERQRYWTWRHSHPDRD